MDKETIINACHEHGAKSVYDAAYKRIAGDHAALSKVSLLDVTTIKEADEIGRIAFSFMGDVDKASDLTDITIDLAKLK